MLRGYISKCVDAVAKQLTNALIAVIKAYQYLLSPWFGQQCRFYPTCSEYSLLAIKQHGALVGCRLMACRLLKCHPWHAGGHDPVP